tara:strand:+ start:772 stop:1320 length:549 start_codon:yes stop_codon:yes gene_type:complete
MNSCTPRVTSKPITSKDYLNDEDLGPFSLWTGDVELEITVHCDGICPKPWGARPGACPEDLVTTPTDGMDVWPIFKKHITTQQWETLRRFEYGGTPIPSGRFSTYVHKLLEQYPDLDKEIQSRLDDMNKKAADAALAKAVATNYCACPTEADIVTGEDRARRKRMLNFTTEYEEHLHRAKFY